MNIKPLLKYYYIGLSILFFVLGVTFQSGIISRKASFIVYTGLLFSILLFMIFDKEISFKNKWEIIDLREIFLFVAMATYRISIYKYYNITDLHETIMCILIPVMLYMFGKYYVLYAGDDSYKKIKSITIPFGMGLMVFYIVSIFSFYYVNPDYIDGDRLYRTVLMPSNGNLNATFYSFYPLLIIGITTYAIISFKENIVINSIVIIMSLVSVLWSWVVIGQRLPMIFLFVSILLSVIIYGIDRVLKNGIGRYKKPFKIVIIMILLVSVVLFILNYFTGIVTEIWTNSSLSRDGGIFWGNIRFKWAAETIKDIKLYPFGNNHKYYYGELITTHVQWVDFAYCGGIVPFLSIMIWLILIFKDVVYISFCNITIKQRLLVIMPFLAYVVYASTETLSSLYYMFYAIMLFAGIVRGQILINKKVMFK